MAGESENQGNHGSVPAGKSPRESRTVKATCVLPPDANHYNTMFGGKLMAYMDDVAAIAAMRHCRSRVVTASTDSVDFLHPVRVGDEVCLEGFVTWTHRTSMEVFVKAVAEDMATGARQVCATAFLTFVAIDEDGKPVPVPGIVPETPQEQLLHRDAEARAEVRRNRRAASRELAARLGTDKPWER